MTIQTILQGLISAAGGAMVSIAALMCFGGFGLACIAGVNIWRAGRDNESLPLGWVGAFFCGCLMAIGTVVSGAFSLLFVG